MKASIDCGTNSFRLLIADVHGRPVEQHLIITRLGKGVHESRRLDDDAISRSLDALRQFKERLDAFQVPPNNVVAVATSAARDAVNGQEFLDGASKALGGAGVRILTGDQEAETTFRGASSGVDSNAPLLVVDIGGGSTELAYGTQGKLQWGKSLDIGCVRLSELALRKDPYEADELEYAFELVEPFLSLINFDVLDQNTRLVGVAGTVTSVAAISKGIEKYEPDCVHGVTLSLAEVQEVTDRLTAMTNDERAQMQVLTKGRADVIVAGAIILQSVMSAGSFTNCIVSERDLLHGLLA